MQTILVIRTTKLECWSRKFAGIQAFARNRDWRLQTIDGTGGNIQVVSLLDFWHPAGCMIESDGASTNLSPEEFGTLPTVFLDHSPDLIQRGASVVRHDSAQIAQLAARELLARDLASYAVIGWFNSVYWAQDKIGAFQQALALHGRTARIFQPRPQEQNDITALQRRLQKWIQQLPRPCGIFGVNDLICEIALSAVTALGIAVPEDIAFVGADDDPLICETAIPSLTSVQPDFFRTGYAAGELLAERIEDPSRPTRLCVVPPIQLVRRLSSRLFHRPDMFVKHALTRIEREAALGLTAQQVLADFPCSRRQAEIRFRAATGHSVLEEIQSIRYVHALELIHDSSVALGAIADRTGWPSSLVLSRYVRQQTGKTLTQIRKEGVSNRVSQTRSSLSIPMRVSGPDEHSTMHNG